MTTRPHRIISALVALLTSALSLHAQTGLTVETWNNLTQSDSIIVLQQEGISDRAADTTTTITSAQLAGPTAAKSGTRLRGSITPVVTDTYTFWINGTDNVALWVSDDASRFNKKLVAYNLGSTNASEWDKHANQKSIPIQLTGGQSYYIEAHVMDKDGGGHAEIAWRGQNGRHSLDLNGATATQSSTKWGKEASGAIDGDTAGVWGKNATTLTNNEANSWLQVDFDQDREINQVVLHNMSSSQNRLSNFRLSVLDANDVELAGQDYFTTTGNVGDSLTWNLPSSLPTARKIKVQLLGLNLAGNGYLALAEVEAYGAGLVTGQINHLEIIPATYLTTLAADPDDTNDNNLSDTFEQQTGLTTSALPGALLEYGDPDNDGISNYQEQWIGSDPLTKEALTNGLTRYIWMGINGSVMTNLTLNSKFYNYPNAIEHVPGVDANLKRTLFGARYRGAIVAPTTGDYRFWISGNGGGAELWFSDGSVIDPATSNPLTNRFGKKRIGTSGHVTPQYDFDYSPNQRSGIIHLVQGQEYYLEVLHAVQNGKNDHVSVAWQVPGGTREIIPAASFLSNNQEATDADDDNLPDAFETTYGLDPTDNGFNDLNESEYGDPDADGLTNLEEFQNSTDPKSADTDGDGYSDSDEVNLYGSDPLTSNNLAPVAITLPPLNQYSAATSSWANNSDGTIAALGRRGGITYTFDVAEAGVHEVAITAEAIYTKYWIAKDLNLVLSINDDPPFASETLSSKLGQPDNLRALTPWLSAGTQTLTIFHDNVLTDLRLRLNSVSISRLGGADLDEDGIPDWIAANQMQANILTRVPTQSRTSPLSIEGITQQLSSTTLTTLMLGAQSTDQILVNMSINNTFFADVPLSPDGDVTLAASFLGGVITESHDVSWIATNLFEFDQSELHIRQGDSLRLDAWSGAADGQSFSVSLDGILLEDENQNTNQTSGEPIVAIFDTAGTYTLSAVHNGQTANVTLQVHTADFGPKHLVHVDELRTWTPPVLGSDAVIEADESLGFSEVAVTSQTVPRSFNVISEQAVNRYVIARLPSDITGAPSAILARGMVHSFDIAKVDETGDAQKIVQYPDGTWLLHLSVVAVNLPEGVMIRLTTKNQGTLFANGDTILELRAGDFDANGIANVYFEWAGVGDPNICHTTGLYIEP